MVVGSKEWLEEYATECKDFFEKWHAVFLLNQKYDYSKGYATTNGNGDFTIIYERGTNK